MKQAALLAGQTAQSLGNVTSGLPRHHESEDLAGMTTPLRMAKVSACRE